jgi:hypothetical protein
MDDEGEAATEPRRRIKEPQRLLVWVRSGGCCAMCGKYLLEGEITARPFALGELAHIVGQGRGPDSPRGQIEMSDEDRDSAENLMLLCRGEHNEIDRKGALDIATIEWLRSIKREHEEHIRQLVSLGRDRRTAVVRVVGDIYGEAGQVTKQMAADTVLRERRFPYFPLTFDLQGVEIDLRGIPGEGDGEAAYWTAAKQRIDEVIDLRLRDAIRTDQIRHVSVFGLARLPLLVYLGSKLDDTFPVALYQRHRDDETWDWKDGDPVAFTVDRPETEAEEAVLVVDVSGIVDPAQLPPALAGLPTFTLRLDGVEAGVDVLASRSSLAAFEREIRGLFASLEAPKKTVRRLHVVAAVPLSAAIALGRAHHPGVHPELVIYARAGNGYAPVLEIP